MHTKFSLQTMSTWSAACNVTQCLTIDLKYLKTCQTSIPLVGLHALYLFFHVNFTEKSMEHKNPPEVKRRVRINNRQVYVFIGKAHVTVSNSNCLRVIFPLHILRYCLTCKNTILSKNIYSSIERS